MVLIKVGDQYADPDFSLLTRFLKVLDAEIIDINKLISTSVDPESEGLFDAGEYFIGSGLVALQRYIQSTISFLGVEPNIAFEMPPMVSGHVSVVSSINSGANYWKHMEEWSGLLGRGGDLKKQSQNTIESLEKITPWDDYTCANLLAIIGSPGRLELSPLLPKIAEWRGNLMSTKD